jgi:hypothetical protein
MQLTFTNPGPKSTPGDWTCTEFDEAFASTRLPERPDYDWAKAFLLRARREMVE